jgi:hypothetical protein
MAATYINLLNTYPVLCSHPGSLQELVVGFRQMQRYNLFYICKPQAPQKNNIVEAIKFKGT